MLYVVIHTAVLSLKPCTLQIQGGEQRQNQPVIRGRPQRAQGVWRSFPKPSLDGYRFSTLPFSSLLLMPHPPHLVLAWVTNPETSTPNESGPLKVTARLNPTKPFKKAERAVGRCKDGLILLLSRTGRAEYRCRCSKPTRNTLWIKGNYQQMPRRFSGGTSCLLKLPWTLRPHQGTSSASHDTDSSTLYLQEEL